MSEVTYAKTRHQCPAPPQRRQEHGRHRVKDLSSYRQKDPCMTSSSWKVLAIVLGIVCLALLAAGGFLATKVIQHSYNPGNTSCNKGNKKVNQNSVNADGHPRNSSCNKEVPAWKQSTCPASWYQHGENCFFFSRMNLPWDKCSGTCTGLNASFVKVDTEEAMDFVIHLSKLQCEMRQEKFFLGLFYNSQQKWVWIDGTEYTLTKVLPRPKNANSKCLHVTNGRMNTGDCQADGYCICKKRLH